MKILIDAGHGPNTPGKRSVDGMKEYEFNSAVAKEVKTNLLQYEGISVLFSHSDKKDVPLQERVALANSEKVDCFLSIHANAYGNGSNWTEAEGIETFIYVTKPHEAYLLATSVQRELVRQTNRKNRGVKQANFYVLKETSMTAILCECGFMTNKEEAALLRSASYRKKCAKAISDAIASHYKLSSKKTTAEKTSVHVYKVQVGAFTHKKHAEQLIRELKQKGYEAILVSS
ncbi:N-acetylmuramoyl-L-alanine amidase [Bacillus weihaiensis]|uniref:Cell wall hydrolase n=1 Tax=Bacillus weihaiensis TaxID=1547283 RepID=A0A1L3MMR9_9BACI|nr:N-acetylmuramoyl-L-alanine amidase [Bacillus weihaiensis]APH03639.1 cell wall hydrolase [Bacillus weihaiensis]